MTTTQQHTADLQAAFGPVVPSCQGCGAVADCCLCAAWPLTRDSLTALLTRSVPPTAEEIDAVRRQVLSLPVEVARHLAVGARSRAHAARKICRRLERRLAGVERGEEIGRIAKGA